MTVSCHTVTTGVAVTTWRLSGNIRVTIRVNEPAVPERDDLPVMSRLGPLWIPSYALQEK